MYKIHKKNLIPGWMLSLFILLTSGMQPYWQWLNKMSTETLIVA